MTALVRFQAWQRPLKPKQLRGSRQHPLSRYFSTSRGQKQDVFYSQMEDAGAAAHVSATLAAARPQTLTEKIVQRYSVGLPAGKLVKAGDYVTIQPHHCMTHDNSWPVAQKFMSIGASRIHQPGQIVMTLDHDVQNKSAANLRKYRNIEDFARRHSVDFYGAGDGIGHQIMVEQGYAWPGTLVVASDSHSNMYGGVACLGTPVVRTDAASIWATGRTWWQVPPVAQVSLLGTLPAGVTGKDIIIALCGLFNQDEVLNHAVEFAGSRATLDSIPIDDRLAIANMTTEWGALSGLFPVDGLLEAWLRAKQAQWSLSANASALRSGGDCRFTPERLQHLLERPLLADRGAEYAKHFYLDISTLSPFVCGPNSVKVATPVSQLEADGVSIDKAYLISCTNSRASDLHAAAEVFCEAARANDGVIPKVADHVSFYVAAASALEREIAMAEGDWQVLLAAGAKPLPAGCGPCIGLGEGLLEAGEVGISASNRNFKGRMGSTEAKAYLASPEIVAASALRGKISSPGWYTRPALQLNGVKFGQGKVPLADEGAISQTEDFLADVISRAERQISAAEQRAAAADDTSSLTANTSSTTDILLGFPEKLRGEIVWCSADNVNTDAIYPGKYTYQDDVTRETMAAVVMENYDPAFASTARQGDVLVSGYNFGCGSSREQAATALVAKGISLVVAGSFGNIFSRNSINNALIGLEVPRLVSRLREAFDGTGSDSGAAITSPAPLSSSPSSSSSSSSPSSSSSSSSPSASPTSPNEPAQNKESLDSPPPGPVTDTSTAVDGAKLKARTRRTGWTLEWNVRNSIITIQEGSGGTKWTQQVGEMPPNVQEIIAKGGLEAWVKSETTKAQDTST